MNRWNFALHRLLPVAPSPDREARCATSWSEGRSGQTIPGGMFFREIYKFSVKVQQVGGMMPSENRVAYTDGWKIYIDIQTMEDSNFVMVLIP